MKRPIQSGLCAGCVLLAGFFSIAGSHAATESPRPARRPNVLLIVTDDQRPDTIRALGNPIIETPNLDALVRRGVTFTRAVAPNPICVVSRAEILTGATSFRNGTLDSGGPINRDLALWPATMRDGGYHTWYVGKWHNDGRPTQRGYEETDGLFVGGSGLPANIRRDCHGREVTGYVGWVFQTSGGRALKEKGVGLTPGIDRHFADAAIRFIDRKPEQPFFLHVNFTGPHDPLLIPPGFERKYSPEELPLPANFLPEHPFEHGNLRGRDEQLLPWPRTPPAVREDVAAYYAVISHLDREIGRILDALERSGQADSTIVIFTSDQGLAIGSHGLRGKQNMYEHTVGTPLVIAGTGIPQDRRCGAQCYLRDLFPTVCEMAGIPVPETVEGRSLRPLVLGETQSVYPCLFGYYRDVQRMIRSERWKLIWYPKIGKYQLFDLKSDPWEQADLADETRCAGVRKDLQAKLMAWLREKEDPVLESSNSGGSGRKLGNQHREFRSRNAVFQ